MDGLTDTFYSVVDSAVRKDCKRLSSALFTEDYLNMLTTERYAILPLFGVCHPGRLTS